MLPKFLLLLGGLTAAGISESFSQCGQTSVLKTAVTNYVDSTGNISRTVNEQSIFEISKTSFTIVAESVDKVMTGKITKVTCNWPTPYKEGISVIDADLTKEPGESMKARLTITGKNGLVTVNMVIDNNQNRQIRLTAISFTEKR